MSNRAHSERTPWTYLITAFAILAMAVLVLPACVAGGGGSGDDDDDIGGECGDGNLEAEVEECDDGNNADGDGCDFECNIEQTCGNGVVEGDEECDDGNTSPGDGCDDSCQLESTCGDGSVTGLEVCDDSNTDPGDGCSETCTSDESCGNGIIDGDLTDIPTGPDEFLLTEDIVDEVCDGSPGCSMDCRAAELSLMVLRMTTGVWVPICARPPSYGIGTECDMERHYHGQAAGFNDAGTTARIEEDPAPEDCGQGKGSVVHPTLRRMTITAGARSQYLSLTGFGSGCWE